MTQICVIIDNLHGLAAPYGDLAGTELPTFLRYDVLRLGQRIRLKADQRDQTS